MYCHCNSIYVSEGQDVAFGEHTADMGDTGTSSGAHLPFEIQDSNAEQDWPIRDGEDVQRHAGVGYDFLGIPNM